MTNAEVALSNRIIIRIHYYIESGKIFSGKCGSPRGELIDYPVKFILLTVVHGGKYDYNIVRIQRSTCNGNLEGW